MSCEQVVHAQPAALGQLSHGGAVECLWGRYGEAVRAALDRPPGAVQLEETLHGDQGLLRRARHLDGHARLPEEPLLAAAEVLAAAEPLQELLVRPGQRNVRADEAQARVAHHRDRRATE